MGVLWVAISMGCSPVSSTAGTAGNGGNSSDNTTGTGAGGATGGGGQGGDGGCVFDCSGAGGNGGNVAGQIVIDPAAPIVTIDNGNIITIPFTAKLNGNDITANVVWLYDRPEIGDINATSTFVPTGIVGGAGKLTAKFSNAEGSTDVTVFIKKTVNSGNLPQTSIDLLDNPNGGADQNMSIAYPYPKTVFPLGVLSPEIQWFGGGAGDGYKIKMTEKYYEYTEYFMQAPPGRHIVPQADWDAIERSGSGSQSDPLTVAVGRLSNGTAYNPELNTWHIAQGKLKGNIYYWELPDQCGSGNGRILRIKPDAEQVDEFFTPGGCWGCHTVSRDGKTMMATLDSGSPFPQVTIDLSQDPAQYAGLAGGQTPLGGTFSAFNEKGDKILVSNDGGGEARLRIADASNGAILNDNAMGNMCGEPAWSPTGKKIAAICNLNSSSWIFDASVGNLAIADVADDGITVSNINNLVLQAGGSGRPAYPSFSPGGDYIAFGRTTQGSRTTGDGDLWLVDINNGANVKKLAIASSDNKSFNPVFAPLRAGGYYWLVYVSRRDYGNRIVGVPGGRQQLWITAVDDPPTAADPSHPPFYVRGQEDCAKSENAYFALPPCKDKGASCLEGSDCCNGQCIKDPGTGMYTCGDPPPPGSCAQDGNGCMSDADCCNFDAANPSGASQCIDGFCTPPVPE